MIILSEISQQLALDFIKEEFKNKPYNFPDELQKVYSHMVMNLERKHGKRNLQRSRSLNDDSQEGVAYQFYNFFHTHYFKFLHTLLKTEFILLSKNSIPNFLTYSTISFIDIGCGSGAGSIALLFLLQKYQKFLSKNNQPLFPIRVQLIAFDPSSNMLELYDQIIEQLQKNFRHWLIDVKYKKLIHPFPKGTDELIGNFKPINSHSVILGMSNVIRPLLDCFKRGDTKLQVLIDQALSGEPFSQNPPFGEAETRAIKSIIKTWKLDKLSLVAVATKDNQWHKELRQIINEIRTNININESHNLVPVYSDEVSFLNPENSYWYERKSDYRTSYYFSYSQFVSENYESQLQTILSHRNIELAWSRSRRYMLHETLNDETEIKLLDYEIERKLDRLCHQILCKEWKALNVENIIYYQLPKNSEQFRPRTLTRIEEQIVATAIIQSLETARSEKKNSYSYHINKDPNEFLYEYWLEQWKQYIQDTQKSAKGKNVLRSDIKECYQTINQDKLLKIVKKGLDSTPRMNEILEKLLVRNIASTKLGLGLPQGHIASGFWSEIYLSCIDRIFYENERFKSIKLARYADDMVFTIPENPSFIKLELEKILKEVGFELSQEKTKIFPADGTDYITATALDDNLDRLNQDFVKTLCKIYKLNSIYEDIYRKNTLDFLTQYQALLEKFSIFISIPWLKRKIEQYLKIEYKNFISQLSYKISIYFTGLKFPSSSLPFPQPEQQEEIWLTQFQKDNYNWLIKVNQIKQRLINLCKSSFLQLDEDRISEKDQKQALRRLKFATSRLCMLGLDEVGEKVVQVIIKHPWQIPVHFICRGLANCNQSFLWLNQILQESNDSYVKAHAVRSLAEIKPYPPKQAIELMWQFLERDKPTECEKLKASEALLVAQQWEIVNPPQQLIQHLIETEQNPYLLKNYILLYGEAIGSKEPKQAVATLEELQQKYFEDYVHCLENNNCKDNCHNLVVIDAIQYLLCKLKQQSQTSNENKKNNLLTQDEPKILGKFYANSYQVSETETMSGSNYP